MVSTDDSLVVTVMGSPAGDKEVLESIKAVCRRLYKAPPASASHVYTVDSVTPPVCMSI